MTDDHILDVYKTDATDSAQATEMADNWASMQDFGEYLLLDAERTSEPSEREGCSVYRVVIIDANDDNYTDRAVRILERAEQAAGQRNTYRDALADIARILAADEWSTSMLEDINAIVDRTGVKFEGTSDYISH